MLHKVRNLVGNKYHKLTVISFHGRIAEDKYTKLWRCQCDCGNYAIVRQSLLLSGNTKTCGCGHRKPSGPKSRLYKHGRCRTKEYRAWTALIGRCQNKNLRQYKDYGGRGISVCDRWRGSFECFLADMGYAPTPQHSIDRIDNDGDYSPINCRWSTKKQQQLNRRNNRVLTRNGVTKTMKEWCDDMNLDYGRVRSRIQRGWDENAALDIPFQT